MKPELLLRMCKQAGFFLLDSCACPGTEGDPILNVVVLI